jgi:hypothetical protein
VIRILWPSLEWFSYSTYIAGLQYVNRIEVSPKMLLLFLLYICLIFLYFKDCLVVLLILFKYVIGHE